MKKILVLFFLFITFVNAQTYTQKDVEICKNKFTLAVDKQLSCEPLNRIILEVGKSFLGDPYKAHTIEQSGKEQLVINLREFDCTTFLENVLALSRCIRKEKTSFVDYENELKIIRYRNGKINTYPSRLHYFSDWIFNNEQKGIVKDITKELGGEKIQFNLNFMSTHPNLYSKLKENPGFIPIIKKQEEEINKRTYYYISKKKIKEIENKIKPGDLIVFTTNVVGLDIGHVGIAVKSDDNRIHILHAPIPNTNVQITELPLSEYVNKIKHDTGIIILKAVDPL